MIIDLAKAVLVGIVASIPVGPILLMVIQRTLCEGRKQGLMVGIGSALADGVYAAIGLFALVMLQDVIEKNSSIILLAGGVFIGFIGVGMLRKKIDLSSAAQKQHKNLFSYVVQSFVSVLSNPAALAVMMGLLAAFGLDSADSLAPKWAVVLGVALGEFLYWLVVSGLLSRFAKFNPKVLTIICRVVGSGVCLFAIYLIVRGIVGL